MPTRRTVSLLTMTQPEQSGGTGQAQSAFTRFGRITSGTPNSRHSVLDQEKGLPPLAAKLRGKKPRTNRCNLTRFDFWVH